jgi:hypothetical protein
MLETSGPREVLRSSAEPISDHDSRGLETPDRQTTRLLTDGSDRVASTGGGRHAPMMGGSTTPDRTYAHYCDEVGSTIYAPRRKCPLGCYRDDDVERGDDVEDNR